MRVASHSDHMNGPDMLGIPTCRFCTLKIGSALMMLEKIEGALLERPLLLTGLIRKYYQWTNWLYER